MPFDMIYMRLHITLECRVDGIAYLYILYANKTCLAVITTDRVKSKQVDFESTVAGPSFGLSHASSLPHHASTEFEIRIFIIFKESCTIY
jgi:hypothetical protein